MPNVKDEALLYGNRYVEMIEAINSLECMEGEVNLHTSDMGRSMLPIMISLPYQPFYQCLSVLIISYLHMVYQSPLDWNPPYPVHI